MTVRTHKWNTSFFSLLHPPSGGLMAYHPTLCLFDRSFSLELLVEIFYFAKRTQNEVFLKFYEKSRRMILLIFCLRSR